MTNVAFFFRIGGSFYTAGAIVSETRKIPSSKVNFLRLPWISRKTAGLLVTSGYCDVRRLTYLHLRCRIDLQGCRRLSALNSARALSGGRMAVESGLDPRSKSG